MLKILWKMGEIAPEEQFHPLSTLFYYLMLNFYVETGIRFSLRLFEITEVEITRVDCTSVENSSLNACIVNRLKLIVQSTQNRKPELI